MTDDVLVRAPAKVNIGLNVLKKREDGYHNIESIFQTVGLFDELSVSLAANDGVCLIEWSELIEELLPEGCIRIIIEKDKSGDFEHRVIRVIS